MFIPKEKRIVFAIIKTANEVALVSEGGLQRFIDDFAENKLHPSMFFIDEDRISSKLSYEFLVVSQDVSESNQEDGEESNEEPEPEDEE